MRLLNWIKDVPHWITMPIAFGSGIVLLLGAALSLKELFSYIAIDWFSLIEESKPYHLATTLPMVFCTAVFVSGLFLYIMEKDNE